MTILMPLVWNKLPRLVWLVSGGDNTSVQTRLGRHFYTLTPVVMVQYGRIIARQLMGSPPIKVG